MLARQTILPGKNDYQINYMGCDYESDCMRYGCSICQSLDQADRHAGYYLYGGTYTVNELVERVSGLTDELRHESDPYEIEHISYAMAVYSHLISYAATNRSANGSVWFSYE
jgi:hypothetical protein